MPNRITMTRVTLRSLTSHIGHSDSTGTLNSMPGTRDDTHESPYESRPRAHRPRWIRASHLSYLRWRRSIAAHPTTEAFYKWTVGLIGAIVIAVGLVLVPLPGPGWLIVLFGVAVVASEFHWAHRLLMWARKKLHAWTLFIKRSHWSVGATIGLVTFLCVTFAVLCVLWFSGIDFARFF